MDSMENKGAEGGFWKPRGEPREIFGDASIKGWEATHEFYEVQGPHVEKTDWLMLEYYITTKVSREALPAKDTKSLCKVFCSSSLPPSDSEMPQNVAGTEFLTENFINSLPPDNFNIPTKQQMQVDTTSRNMMQRADSLLLSHPVENLPELDIIDPDDYIALEELEFIDDDELEFIDDDVYLGLSDLDIPESPPSDSDDSSCVTMLSDECFNYLDAMLGLVAESGDHVEHKDGGCNFGVFDSSKPDDVVQTAISGLFIEEISSENARDGKEVSRDSSPPLTLDSQSSELLDNSQTPSADGRNETDGRSEKLKRKASSSQSSDGSSSGQAPSPGHGEARRLMKDSRSSRRSTCASSHSSSSLQCSQSPIGMLSRGKVMMT
ncbi:protein NTM1-like 9 [Eucalyptus grandis]|uniref:protein NTM1-like 9 n=1 Tax=Eucalyptus grandis TaxID=71139 RepID=UPI00192EC2CC|nr:protein NTM1-like 9 [Eucalyptus grandis]